MAQQFAQAAAAHLVAMGVGPEERVALMLPTSEAYFASFFGALFAGAVPVPIYPPFRQDALEAHVVRQGRILENAGASVLIATGDVATAAAGLRARVTSLRQVVTPEELGGPGRLPIRTTPAQSGSSAQMIDTRTAPVPS